MSSSEASQELEVIKKNPDIEKRKDHKGRLTVPVQQPHGTQGIQAMSKQKRVREKQNLDDFGDDEKDRLRKNTAVTPPSKIPLSHQLGEVFWLASDLEVHPGNSQTSHRNLEAALEGIEVWSCSRPRT